MPPHNGNHKTKSEAIDDVEAYVATFSEDEREHLAAAETAIDIAILLHRAREHRGLTQAAAAQRAGLQQQAVSRFERQGAKPQMETVQTYLAALGYGVELTIVDLETGEAAVSMMLPLPNPRQTA